ncbi:hypothetical protein IWX90DRAFT_283682 [Phyllosticta citrichinensis]|uniref:Uncharacterized protein n=1 Tax=Phyllosticta citrichinensis TaxID=1130410 RepID=A0ABR1XNV3_9PEZI
MSSSAKDQKPDALQDRRQSIGKYVKRLRTVLKKNPSKDSSATPSAAPSDSKEHSSLPTSPPETKPAESKPVSSTVGQTSYPRNAAQQERAHALFAKYGLTLEAHEWITTAISNENVQRVEKPIRMRVHRTCHRCQTTFGPDRVCQKCEHTRCKKCPRYPAKKEDKAKGKARAGEPQAAPPVVVAPTQQNVPRIGSKPAKKGDYLTMKSRTGGPDLERRPPKQRVRRTCHKCDSLFMPPTAASCPSCSHVRCTKCPRDPAKKKKWPDGYPGDAPASESETDVDAVKRPDRTWRKPRQRVRWTCENCQTLFMEKSKSCANCGHDRCLNCPRAPAKKHRKETDPAVLESVEEKLSRFNVNEPISDTETTPDV